ncbi:MAG: hypothetical protein RLZZ01_1403 [Actinomycetota bacterium]
MHRATLVGLGAACGAVARLGTTSWSGDAGSWPWGTLLANLAGCAAIGCCAARLERDSAVWAFLVPGTLGGLTTASAFAVETRTLVVDRPLVAAGYVAASAGGGLVLAATARRLGTRSRKVLTR